MDDLELRTGLDEPLREDQYAVLFDGVCPLCNRSAQFIIARDRKKRAVFAPLQSEIGQALAPGELDTMIVLAKNRRLERSSAALFVARRLDGLWFFMAIFVLVPRCLRDRVYDWIAVRRHRMKAGTCALRLDPARQLIGTNQHA